LAIKTLQEAGIETYALICPVMPFLTDVEALIEMVTPYVDTIWFYGLIMKNIGDRNWRYVSRILNQHFPEHQGDYKRIAFLSDHPYWIELRHKLEEIQLDTGLKMEIRV
jgi:DNA repair photolyase